jgi:hypothetical protein
MPLWQRGRATRERCVKERAPNLGLGRNGVFQTENMGLVTLGRSNLGRCARGGLPGTSWVWWVIHVAGTQGLWLRSCWKFRLKDGWRLIVHALQRRLDLVWEARRNHPVFQAGQGFLSVVPFDHCWTNPNVTRSSAYPSFLLHPLLPHLPSHRTRG